MGPYRYPQDDLAAAESAVAAAYQLGGYEAARQLALGTEGFSLRRFFHAVGASEYDRPLGLAAPFRGPGSAMHLISTLYSVSACHGLWLQHDTPAAELRAWLCLPELGGRRLEVNRLIGDAVQDALPVGISFAWWLVCRAIDGTWTRDELSVHTTRLLHT